MTRGLSPFWIPRIPRRATSIAMTSCLFKMPSFSAKGRQSRFEKIAPYSVVMSATAIPAPMEEGKFYPDKNIQQDAYLFAGAIMTHKGIHQILDFADSQKGEGKVFHFAGRAVNKSAMERIKKDYTYLGEVTYDEMPQLYRKYKSLLFNSQMPETFGLTILEAMASGCTIIKFSKTHEIGLESYRLSPGELMKRCFNAPDNFWKIIEKKVM